MIIIWEKITSQSMGTGTIIKDEAKNNYQHQKLGSYFCLFQYKCRSLDSSVGIATSYGMDNRGVGV
jgi:hypothetical protein